MSGGPHAHRGRVRHDDLALFLGVSPPGSVSHGTTPAMSAGGEVGVPPTSGIKNAGPFVPEGLDAYDIADPKDPVDATSIIRLIHGPCHACER